MEGRHHFGRPSGVASLKEEEGEEKGRVMVLVVVLVKMTKLDFVGEGKKEGDGDNNAGDIGG